MPTVLPFVSFLPIKDYYVSDTEQRLYFNEIALYDKDGYFRVRSDSVSYPALQVGSNGVSDYLSFFFTENADFSVQIQYCYHHEVVKSHTIQIHVRMDKIPQKKYLFLGDSLTEAEHMQAFFRELNPESVTLCGTRTRGLCMSEGRSSWGVNHYFAAEKGEVKNPFYNPETETFDFSFYMENHPEFKDVDVVNIFLGRNNGYNPDIMDKIDLMVASVKAFNPDITVTLMGAYNVAPDNTGTGRYLQSADDFNYSAHVYNKAFYERYEKSANVLLIPAHLNLDNKHDYTMVEEPVSAFDDRTVMRYNNNVHPDVRGYKKLGAAISAFFRFYWNK